MKRRLSAVEARKRLGEVLEGVFYRGDEVVIERAGKPMAVVIPASMYEQMERRRREAWDRMFALIDRAQERNKDVPAEVLEAEIEQAIREVREEQRPTKRSKAAGE